MPPLPPPVPLTQASVRASRPAPQPRRHVPVKGRTKIWSEEYLSGDAEAVALVPDGNGLPRLRLVRERNWLALQTPGGGLINPKSTGLYKLDIFSLSVRGSSHYAAATKRAALSPGSTVRLVREPENEFDGNAIAIYANTGGSPIGYVNKMNARRLAKRLDSGEEFVAITTRGSAAGRDDEGTTVLITTPAILARLRSA